MTGSPPKRIVLVGFMGAGKSAVGRLLAQRLGWRFEDTDAAVEAEAGRSIARIFEEEGESAFRELEERIMERLVSSDEVVIASGGGWSARPGRLDALPPGTLSVWLGVGAEEALRRSSEAPGTRPLLEVTDPLARAEALLEERERFYAAADVGVDTNGSSVEDVTARILEIVAEKRTQSGTE